MSACRQWFPLLALFLQLGGIHSVEQIGALTDDLGACERDSVLVQRSAVLVSSRLLGFQASSQSSPAQPALVEAVDIDPPASASASLSRSIDVGVQEPSQQMSRSLLGGSPRAFWQEPFVWLPQMFLQGHAAARSAKFGHAYLLASLFALLGVVLAAMAFYMIFEPDFGPLQQRRQQRSLVGQNVRSRQSRASPPQCVPQGAEVVAPVQPPEPPKLPCTSQGGSEPAHLCPSLVVPPGMELLLRLREGIAPERRQSRAFDVVDLKGIPLCRVIADAIGPDGAAIRLELLDGTPLALVCAKGPSCAWSTDLLNSGSRSELSEAGAGCLNVAEIFSPEGEVYAVLSRRDWVYGSYRYILRSTMGRRLLIFCGDFREKAVNVVNASGRLVSDTERCEVDFDNSPYYQVRVAPNVDAGLVLCGLLAIDRLEGEGQAG